MFARKRDVALVVPTIREASLKRFVQEWSAERLFDRVDLIVMEDNPKRTFERPTEAVAHFDWADVDKTLGDKAWIVPRRSDTVRSFAYYAAWAAGYPTIMTLDDDCYPVDRTCDDDSIRDPFDCCGKPAGERLVDGHELALSSHPRWMSTIDGRPRGLPYGDLGKLPVKVNHGLWTNVADLDAPTQLSGGELDVRHDGTSRVVPRGVYFPMCGMNVAWRREATPLMYHLLMGRATMKPGDEPQLLPYDRMGDIFCGVLMKKACDHLGWSVATGTPYIRHDRASNVFANLAKEANGIVAHEGFWKHVDATRVFFSTDAPSVYKALARQVKSFVPEDRLVAERSIGYFETLGDAMLAWAELFE